MLEYSARLIGGVVFWISWVRVSGVMIKAIGGVMSCFKMKVEMILRRGMFIGGVETKAFFLLRYHKR